MPEVLWLTRYGPEGASSRYRAYQYAQPLDDAGFHARFEPLAPWRAGALTAAGGVADRLRTVRRSIDAPAILAVQKEPIMPPRLWRLVRQPLLRRARPLLWDLDDAVWIGAAGAERMAADMAALATVAIAGNDLIAEWLERHGAADVRVIPTCYDPAGPVPDELDDGRVRIVWVGSPATAERLRSEIGLLDGALRSPSVELTCVGAPPFPVDSYHPVRFLPWSRENEHAALSEAHFGLALLPRDPYSDHKCGFKIVQYLAYGVTPIATRSPVHEAIVGPLGMLVGHDTTGDQLTDRLREPPSAEERRAARSRWRDRYSVAAGSALLLDVLRGVEPGGSSGETSAPRGSDPHEKGRQEQ